MKLVMDVLTPGLAWQDIEHERAIEQATLRMVAGASAAERLRHGEVQRRLISQRSPAAVEAMERAGSLHPSIER